MIDIITNAILPLLSISFEDFGIGPYEYQGAKGVDISIQPVISLGKVEVSFNSSFGTIEEIREDLPKKVEFFKTVAAPKGREEDVDIEATLISYISLPSEGKVVATYIWGK